MNSSAHLYWSHPRHEPLEKAHQIIFLSDFLWGWFAVHLQDHAKCIVVATTITQVLRVDQCSVTHVGEDVVDATQRRTPEGPVEAIRQQAYGRRPLVGIEVASEDDSISRLGMFLDEGQQPLCSCHTPTFAARVDGKRTVVVHEEHCLFQITVAEPNPLRRTPSKVLLLTVLSHKRYALLQQ